MKKFAIVFIGLVLAGPSPSQAQGTSAGQVQGSSESSTAPHAIAPNSANDKPSTSTPVSGSGVAGEPTASGAKASTDPSRESENPGNRSK